MRKRRSGYHHGDLRAAMILATEQMVAEVGPEAVTMREVARRANVSSGAPFHHFPNRKALMTAVAEEATHRLRARIEGAVEAIPGAGAVERLGMIGRAYLGWALDNPASFKVVSDRRLIDYSEAIQADNESIQGLMRGTLMEAVALGAVAPVDVDLVMLQMRAMAYGLARMFVDGHLPQWGAGNEPLRHVEAALDAWLPQVLPTRC